MPVFANVHVYLRRDVEGQKVKETTYNITLDMVMARENHGPGDNPWRVANMKANVVKEVAYKAFWVGLEQTVTFESPKCKL